MQWFFDLFGQLQQWLFEQLVQPALFELGLASITEDAFAATGWLLVGLVQIALMLSLMRLLERWRPVEPVRDRAAVRVDVVYTLIHRLGLFRVVLFFTLDPLWDLLIGKLRVQGMPTFQLDALWPGVTDIALVSFAMYLLLFDFVDYLLHRGQHRWQWWWQLHGLHHSQRQLTIWSDNRNHLLDDVIRDSVLVLVGLLVGIAPGQFVAVVAFTQLLESLSHANARLSYGPLERWVVSPRYHRWHHRTGDGELDDGHGRPGGDNFSVLFPIWDRLFGTANFDERYVPTGLPDDGRDWGRGFWAQQWLGLKRLAGRG
jgi:sterol desaturase/sphingolipid hydroxylase (fatty acid hydroxylase superfamily)